MGKEKEVPKKAYFWEKIHLMKSYLLCCLLILMALPAFAQEPLYRVRVASLKKPFDAKRFDQLKALGRLSFEDADNGFTRVYLGNYIGRAAAKQVASLAAKKGYKGAYTVLDNSRPSDAAGHPLNTTWQLATAKQLDAARFYLYNEDIQRQILISYAGGQFRISIGYYAEGDRQTEQAMKQFASFMGFSDGFSRRVGAAGQPAPVAKAPAATAAKQR
jgi:hypothetical protein